ncbi:sodium-dependent nutrient amino acid transporter 1-like [Plodia interpunctella]|uniref:sodium-dependent nutrient amino acid transporter 1-like n=1 Tax=Plodia interpunctella TaxID=58824 RepID=UPI002367D6A8|nr:sodium-dependent nutrient amino acid transporter 1-like [Plodia interpunctella]
MSESESTRSKSASRSADVDTVSSDDSPLVPDRWSNNISYRQLVMSSCIGITQVWWHPYIHDLSRLLPFIFLYNVFSMFVGYPMFYLELAMGVVTKKSLLNCWDLAPMARGVGVAMLLSSVFCVFTLSVICAWSLAMLVHSFHSFLPWLHCAAKASPPCAARHRQLSPGSETPAQSFFFNFVLDLKRSGLEGGLGNVVWELSCYYVVSWFLIYCIAVKRIYSYSKIVLFKDVLSYLTLITFSLGVMRLDGASKMFHDCDWGALLRGTTIWREAVEFSLIQMTVTQGSLVMLGAYCPKQQHKLGTTSLLAFVVSKTSCMASALILGATHGALYTDYGNSTNIMRGAGASMILWSDYVARIPGSQFWSALLFFTIFVLSLSSCALLVQTMISSFSGRSIQKITWVFLIVICMLSCLLGVMTLCTQGGLYIVNFLMEWPVTRPRVAVAAAVGFVITFVYGQTTFCEDVYFAVGEYPSVFMRVCWAIFPPIMMLMFLTGTGLWPAPGTLAGWFLVIKTIMPIIFIMLFYLVFKIRVRNIVRDEK